MKHTLTLLALILSSSLAHAGYFGVDENGYDINPDYTFTTSTGIGKWGAAGTTTPATTDISGGDNYNGITFTLFADSLNADTPYESAGSLTEVAVGADSAFTAEEASEYFVTGATVSLTSLSIFTRRDGVTSDLPDGTTVTLTDAFGNSITSSIATYTAVQANDPWAPSSWYVSRGLATFEFAEDVYLKVGTEYTVTFSNPIDLTVTKNAGEGFDVAGAAGWDAAVIITTETIPEPSTATLGLLALAGLLARRRRENA